MIKKSAVSRLLFRAVCIVFSAALLMLTLISNVKLMAAESRCTELEEQIRLAECETEILKVRIENRISLQELEDIAVNQLGMHRPGTDQLYFDMLPG